MQFLKRLVREPLVHFLVLGGLLFGVDQWRGGQAGGGPKALVVTAHQLEQLEADFAQTWQRAASQAERQGLIDAYVKEEVATREALQLGLDRDDAVIRRRLQQKLEALLVDEARPATAPDAEFKAWLSHHPKALQPQPRVAFRQVYLNPARHGERLDADARALLAQLRAAGPQAAIDSLGDMTTLPAEQPLQPLPDVAQAFGEGFAQGLLKLQPGQWAGPVESSSGVHVVLLIERQAGRPTELAEVRAAFERDWLAAQRRADLQAMYDRLLARYTVQIEAPAGARAP